MRRAPWTLRSADWPATSKMRPPISGNQKRPWMCTIRRRSGTSAALIAKDIGKSSNCCERLESRNKSDRRKSPAGNSLKGVTNYAGQDVAPMEDAAYAAIGRVNTFVNTGQNAPPTATQDVALNPREQRAEGTGVEPATPCGATDFESVC